MSANDALKSARDRAVDHGLPYDGAVTPKEAYELLQQVPGAKLVDVRTRAEWDWVGRIPGAIDYASLRGGLAGVLPKDKAALVVAYCGNEKCQAYRTAAKAVAALGYTNVKHYAPGIAGWRASGAKIEKGAE